MDDAKAAREDAKKTLMNVLSPVFDVVKTLSLDDAPAARAALQDKFPAGHAVLNDIGVVLAKGIDAGTLCDRENGGVRFSRLLKPSQEVPWAIDLVRMDGPGPGHTHPQGEVDLCFAVADDDAQTPRFDEQPEGFTVYPPASWHVPTVSGGTMNIIYFLPEGAITFEPRPAGA